MELISRLTRKTISREIVTCPRELQKTMITMIMTYPLSNSSPKKKKDPMKEPMLTEDLEAEVQISEVEAMAMSTEDKEGSPSEEGATIFTLKEELMV